MRASKKSQRLIVRWVSMLSAWQIGATDGWVSLPTSADSRDELQASLDAIAFAGGNRSLACVTVHRI